MYHLWMRKCVYVMGKQICSFNTSSRMASVQGLGVSLGSTVKGLSFSLICIFYAGFLLVGLVMSPTVVVNRMALVRAEPLTIKPCSTLLPEAEGSIW